MAAMNLLRSAIRRCRRMRPLIAIRIRVMGQRIVSVHRYQRRINTSQWSRPLMLATGGFVTYNYIQNNSLTGSNAIAASGTSLPKIAVITGGASGIGKGIAMKCGKEKFDAVIIIDINKKNSNKTKQEFLALYPNTKIITFIADTTKRENIANIVHKLKSKYHINEITHLFNNAGIALTNVSLYGDKEENLNNLHRVMDINFWSHIYCTQLFLPFLTDHKSYIVNTASVVSVRPATGMYDITKHAMAAYSQTLVHQFKVSGEDKYKDIEILCLCPGFVATDLVDNSVEIVKEKDKEVIERAKGFNKWMMDYGMTTEECANIVFQAIENGDFWIFPHKAEAHYLASIRYESWITRKYDQEEFGKQIRPNYGKFSFDDLV